MHSLVIALCLLAAVCCAAPSCGQSSKAEATAMDTVSSHVVDLVTLNGRQIELNYVLERLLTLPEDDTLAQQKFAVELMRRLLDTQTEIKALKAKIDTMNVQFTH